MIKNNRIFKISTLAFALFSCQYAHSAVTGTFASGGGNGGAMDKEYVNNYPYSRCSDEFIPSEDCKEFGFVFGTEPMTLNEFKALIFKDTYENYTDDLAYTADMVTDNYGVPDNFFWTLPRANNIQYAISETDLIKANTFYPYWSDENSDDVITEDEIYLAALPMDTEPTNLDNNTSISALMIAIAYDDNGVPIDNSDGDSDGVPGEPGERLPIEGGWEGYVPDDSDGGGENDGGGDGDGSTEPDPTPAYFNASIEMIYAPNAGGQKEGIMKVLVSDTKWAELGSPTNVAFRWYHGWNGSNQYSPDVTYTQTANLHIFEWNTGPQSQDFEYCLQAFRFVAETGPNQGNTQIYQFNPLDDDDALCDTSTENSAWSDTYYYMPDYTITDW